MFKQHGELLVFSEQQGEVYKTLCSINTKDYSLSEGIKQNLRCRRRCARSTRKTTLCQRTEDRTYVVEDVVLNQRGGVLVVQHDSSNIRTRHEPQCFVDVVVANHIASLTQGEENKKQTQ